MWALQSREILPINVYRQMLRCFDVNNSGKLPKGFRGSKVRVPTLSKAKTYRDLRRAKE